MHRHKTIITMHLERLLCHGLDGKSITGSISFSQLYHLFNITQGNMIR
jgi:hypothetical protein